jgi:hypothetical protein
MLVVSGDADLFRELAHPVSDGIVWYAVTMRMESPVTGVASVDGSPGPPRRFSKLGFSAVDRPFTSRGFWLDPDRDTGIENTEMQTFLTRYSFEANNSEGFAARDTGIRLVDSDGFVFARPRVKMDGNFSAERFSHLSLKKSGPEKLIVDRVAIARTPQAALYPQLPAVARRPGGAPATTEPTPSSAGETKPDAAPANPDEGKPAADAGNAPPGDKAGAKPETKNNPS